MTISNAARDENFFKMAIYLFQWIFQCDDYVLIGGVKHRLYSWLRHPGLVSFIIRLIRSREDLCLELYDPLKFDRPIGSNAADRGPVKFQSDVIILNQPISRLRDFTRSYDKTSYRLLKRWPERMDSEGQWRKIWWTVFVVASAGLHLNGNVVILRKFSSLATTNVVILTTFRKDRGNI